MQQAHQTGSTSKRFFRLPLLLVLVGLVPLTFALIYVFIVIPSQRSQREQRVAAQLKALRADVRLDAENRVSLVSCPGCELSPEMQSEFAQLEHLKSLDLSGTQFNDNGLAHLKGLTRLETLRLDKTPISDVGLKHLSGLVKLEILTLQETQTSDAGMEHLRGMVNLHMLVLNDTQITDAGLDCLGGMTNLEYLHLSGTRVTDQGLESLKKLVALSSVDLVATDVTQDGISFLKTTMPKCQPLYVRNLNFENRQRRSEPLENLRGN